MEMIERVARVIDPEAFERYEDAYRRRDGWQKIYLAGAIVAAKKKASDAIEAMKVPTDEMISAGLNCDAWANAEGTATEILSATFSAMIEAALKEKVG